MIGKGLRHFFRDFGNHRISDWARERRNRGLLLGEFAEGFSILVVEIPVATFGLAILGHEDVVFRPESAVVGLHEKVFLAGSPSCKVLFRHEKLGTAMGNHGNTEFFGETGEGVKSVVFIRIQ